MFAEPGLVAYRTHMRTFGMGFYPTDDMLRIKFERTYKCRSVRLLSPCESIALLVDTKDENCVVGLEFYNILWLLDYFGYDPHQSYPISFHLALSRWWLDDWSKGFLDHSSENDPDALVTEAYWLHNASKQLCTEHVSSTSLPQPVINLVQQSWRYFVSGSTALH
jgi:hypothetical protein